MTNLERRKKKTEKLNAKTLETTFKTCIIPAMPKSLASGESDVRPSTMIVLNHGTHILNDIKYSLLNFLISEHN